MCSKQNRRLKSKCFTMITGINESITSTKHTSCKCKCKFDGRKCNSNQRWNNNKSLCECKNLKEHHVRKKDYICNSATCSCENGKYFASIVDNSVITCDEFIEEPKSIPISTVPATTIPIKSYSTKFCILLAFLLITITLLILVSIYCYLVKYQAKQKPLFPKPLRIRFDKGDRFITVYDRTRYFVLFGGKKYDFIYNRIRYPIGVKSGITYVFSHHYAKIKVG